MEGHVRHPSGRRLSVGTCTSHRDGLSFCFAEYEELKRLLPEMVRFEPTWEELELYKDGGVAIIDQWVCSHARYSGRSARLVLTARCVCLSLYNGLCAGGCRDGPRGCLRGEGQAQLTACAMAGHPGPLSESLAAVLWAPGFRGGCELGSAACLR